MGADASDSRQTQGEPSGLSHKLNIPRIPSEGKKQN